MRLIHESVRATAPKILLEIDEALRADKDVRVHFQPRYRIDTICWDGERCRGGVIVRKVLTKGLSRAESYFIGIGQMRGYVLQVPAGETDVVYAAHPLKFEELALQQVAYATQARLDTARDQETSAQTALLDAVTTWHTADNLDGGDNANAVQRALGLVRTLTALWRAAVDDVDALEQRHIMALADVETKRDAAWAATHG